MIDDFYIKNMFFNKYGRLNGNHSTEEWLKANQPDTLKYLNYRYNDSQSLREVFLRIYNGIEERPKCPICGNVVSWRGKKQHLFNDTCGSGACYCKLRDKRMLIKYGKTNFGGEQSSILKSKKTKLERYGNENYNNINKIKKTNKEKYGKEFTFQVKSIREKGRQTCLERYGVDVPSKSKEILKKMKQTCLERYGVDNYRKSDECQLKVLNSKKLHNTVTSSSIEEKVNLWLIEKFGNTDVKRQYVDVRYKDKNNNHLYQCDFYISSLDLFIEINCHWSHGHHPFDKNDKNDLKRLEKLKDKSDRISYKNAINVWTKRDIEKRSIAKENNLNYIEIFDIKILKETFFKKISQYEKI